MIDLDAAEAICNAASDGPWKFGEPGDGLLGLRTPGGYCVLRVSGHEAASDTTFIAFSRSALPEAIAEIRALKTQLAVAAKVLVLLGAETRKP